MFQALVGSVAEVHMGLCPVPTMRKNSSHIGFQFQGGRLGGSPVPMYAMLLLQEKPLHRGACHLMGQVLAKRRCWPSLNCQTQLIHLFFILPFHPQIFSRDIEGRPGFGCQPPLILELSSTKRKAWKGLSKSWLAANGLSLGLR